MRTMTRGLLLAAAATCLSSPLHAQEMSAEDAAQLRARLDALEAEVSTLRARLETAEAERVTETVAASDAATPSPAPPAPATEMAFKGAPEISSGDWSFKPRGRLQFDVAGISAPDPIDDDGLGFTSEVRRARLGISGDMPGGFGYKFELDFADSEVAFTDAYLSYEDGPFGVKVGQHNNFQSLDELTSSNYGSFMERAAFTDAFGFERRVGVSLDYASGDVLAQGGIFSSSIADLGDDGNQTYGLDGRLVYLPKLGSTQLHLGGSLHWRDLDDDGASVRYRLRPFVHTTDTRFIDTGSFDADSETSYGLEAAAIMGPLHLAGETHWLSAARPDMDDPTFFGAYAEIGYFLTPGDTRGYKGGIFDRVKPANPVGEGGWGALQANLRFDHLDLTDDTIIGGTQNAYAASLVWTATDYVRFILNYAHINYDNAAILAGSDSDYSVDVVGARAQVDF